MSASSGAVLTSPPPPPVVPPEVRRQVEDLVCGLPGVDVSAMAFEQPWEIRAFAMAVAAHRGGLFDWKQMQSALIASIDDWEREHSGAAPTSDAEGGERGWSYYEHWLAALEGVLADAGLVDEGSLEEQTQAVLAVPASTGHHDAHTEPIAVDPAR